MIIVIIAMILLYDCYMIIIISYLPTPPLGQDMTQAEFLSGV